MIDKKHDTAQTKAFTETVERGQRNLQKMNFPSDPTVVEALGEKYRTIGYHSHQEDGKTVTQLPGENADLTHRYENTIDTASGTIIAHHNKRHPDKTEVPGSEILFQQYKEAVGGQLQQQPLRVLERSNVISGGREPTAGSGMAVMNHLRESQSGERIFQPDSDGFKALIGTVNGSSAVFLVKDHGQELGISGIDRAELTTQGFKVHFTPLDGNAKR